MVSSNIIVGVPPGVQDQQSERKPSLFADMRAGAADIRQGWEHRQVWRALALNDVTTRYRRTVLGPFWLTLQMAMWVIGIGLLYSQLFQRPIETFLPFVAAGILMWSFLSGITVEGGSVFIAAQGYIKSAALPLSTYAYRVTMHQIILFLHSMVVIFAVLIVFGVVPSWSATWSVPLSFALATVNGFMACLWLGCATARFRDIQPFTAATMSLLMFLSPVFWSPGQLNRPAWAVAWNPYAWFIQTFREGLIGEAVVWPWWFLIFGLTVVNAAVTLIVFGRCRRRIAYWV